MSADPRLSETFRILSVFTMLLSLFCFGTSVANATSEKKLLPLVEPDDNGMHRQPWFLNSFLDLREDAAEAAAENKQLVILWEQRGCPYCKEMHRVNMRQPEIVDYIKKHFVVVQLNIWGDREVTDFDGQTMTEKKLARKWRVQFTPTMNYFAKDAHKMAKAKSQDAEIWRLMGYWKPFHFHHSFVYVQEKGYKTEPNFQRWLQGKAEELRAKGIEVKLW